MLCGYHICEIINNVQAGQSGLAGVHEVGHPDHCTGTNGVRRAVF